MPPPPTKRCTGTCRAELPLAAFYQLRGGKGTSAACQNCLRAAKRRRTQRRAGRYGEGVEAGAMGAFVEMRCQVDIAHRALPDTGDPQEIKFRNCLRQVVRRFGGMPVEKRAAGVMWVMLQIFHPSSR